MAIPAAALLVYSGIAQRNHALNDARMDTQRLAERIASEQRTLVASAKQLVVSVSQLPEVKNKDATKVNRFLSNLIKLQSEMAILFIADRTGTIWASALPVGNPITISDRRYFKNALASGKLSSGEFQLSRISGKPTFHFGFPYRNDDGEVVGVVCVGIALQDYGVVLKRANLPERSNIALIDYKGLFLFNARDPDKYYGKQSSPALFQRMMAGPDTGTLMASGIAGDLPGQERYLSYQKLRLEGEESPYMYIRVGIPVESVLSQANKDLVATLLLFTTILSSALFLAWLIGKRSIADRVALLKEASQSFADGDLRIRFSDLIKGGELGMLGEAFEAMARKLAFKAESLSSSQRFLNAIIDTEPECLKMLDVEGRILMMNPAGVKLLGAGSFEQVQGQIIFSFITPEHRDAFLGLTRNVFQGVSGNLEFEAVCLDGKRVWLDTHVVPFRNDADEIISLLGITRDITDRKVVEKSLAENQRQLKDLNVSLEQRIADAVAELRRKDQILMLQGRQAAMGEMIGNIAHQWRQPLNTLGLILQELKMTYGRDEFNKDSLEKNVKKAMQVIMHMSQTIEDFSNYFKPDKEKKSFNVKQAVDKTLSLIEPSLKSLDINIELIEEDFNIEVYGYANEYSQVLLNILLNCRDAFAECTVGKPRIITITLIKESNRSVITVADNAEGIPEDILDKVFDPYFTTKGPDKGTGIGLYMAKTIIEKNMGGRLTVHNTSVGAEFRVEV